MQAAVRPFLSDDLESVLRVLAEAMPLDPISVTKFTRQVLLDQNFRKAGALVAEVEGRVVGFCLAMARHMPLENAASDAERGYITLLGVLPDHRRRGIGMALLAAAENYLREQKRSLIMVSSYSPGYFIPGVDVNGYSEAMEFFSRHGYQEVYRPLAMQTSLWNWETPAWVLLREEALSHEGLKVRNYEPQLTVPLLEFASEEFPGDWVRVVREAMGRIVQGDSPARLIVAEEKGRVLGFSHFENERLGPIGVEGSQRGRGIGQVLMYRTLTAQREAGFRAAWFLWSDDKTAERIYNAAGFRETRRFALLKKTLV
jgi:mycothiol synthase